MHAIPAPKDGKPKTRFEKKKQIFYCNFYEKWSVNKTHISEGCKKRKASEGKATLQANLAFLISNIDEDQLFSHINLGMCMHIHDFSDNDNDSTISDDTNLSAPTR